MNINTAICKKNLILILGFLEVIFTIPALAGDSRTYITSELRGASVQSEAGNEATQLRSFDNNNPAAQNYVYQLPLMVTVFRNKQELIAGFNEHNPLTCLENTIGDWNLTVFPQQGMVTYGIEYAPSIYGDCPGILFRYNTINYTWNNSNPSITFDNLNATWRGIRDTVNVTLNISLASIKITSADLIGNNIHVNIDGPLNSRGILTVTAQGINENVTMQANGGAPAFPGGWDIMLPRPNLPLDVYRTLKAEWAASAPAITSTYTLATPWTVFGLVQHTQYNTPEESQCGGIYKSVYIFSADCSYQKIQVKSQFAAQVENTGTGISSAVGLIRVLGENCAANKPALANRYNSFILASKVEGACLNSLVPDTSVAVYPNPKPAGQCTDNRLFVTFENVTQSVAEVDDYCPACRMHPLGFDNHIDHYSSSNACRLFNLENFWTATTTQE